MYLSIQNRALVAAHLREGKEEEANKIINEWHSDKSAEYPEVPIAQRKLQEEQAHLDKLTTESK